MMRSIASLSNARNATSPSSRKISGMVRPHISSMLRSSVVLPLQLKPTRIKLSIRCPIRLKIAPRLVEAIAAELDAHGVGQHQGDHRLTHDARGRQDTYIATFDVGNIALARGVVDRGQR